MYDKIKQVEIVLENTESFRIDGKHIGICVFSDIKKSIHNAGISAFDITEEAETILLEIHKAADTLGSFEDKTLFKRIRSTPDIVYFNILLHDHETDEMHEERIFADFHGERINIYQDVKLGSNGNLYILISKDKNWSDFNINFDKNWCWQR